MFQTRKLIVVGLLTLLVFLPGPGGRCDDSSDVTALMQRKLKDSQKVLEGIAMNRLDQVAKNADDLAALSRQAEWKVLKTPRYQLYSAEFQRIAEELGRNARNKSLDGAALSYVELTLTCVKCHKHVREERMARLDRK